MSGDEKKYLNTLANDMQVLNQATESIGRSFAELGGTGNKLWTIFARLSSGSWAWKLQARLRSVSNMFEVYYKMQEKALTATLDTIDANQKLSTSYKNVQKSYEMFMKVEKKYDETSYPNPIYGKKVLSQKVSKNTWGDLTTNQRSNVEEDENFKTNLQYFTDEGLEEEEAKARAYRKTQEIYIDAMDSFEKRMKKKQKEMRKSMRSAPKHQSWGEILFGTKDSKRIKIFEFFKKELIILGGHFKELKVWLDSEFNMTTKLKKVGGYVKDIGKGIFGGAKAVGQGILGRGAEAKEAFKPLTGIFSSAFGRMGKQAAGSKFGKRLGKMGRLAVSDAKWLGSKGMQAGGWLGRRGKDLAVGAGVLGKATGITRLGKFTKDKIAKKLEKVLPAVNAMAKSFVSILIKALMGFMIYFPLIILVFMALRKAFGPVKKWASKNKELFLEIKNQLIGIFHIVKDLFKAIWDGDYMKVLKIWFTRLLPAVFKLLLNVVKVLIKLLWVIVKEIVKVLANMAKTIIKGIGKAIKDRIPGFHKGGISGGGLSLVGERGPELVNLPRGARVHSNADSMRMGGNTIHVHVSGRVGASDSEIKDIATKVAREINLRMNRTGTTGMGF